jgi:hypothetical protein
MQLLFSFDQGIKCLLTRLTIFLRILGEFSINNITGEITTNVTLDREERSHFMLRVIAQDGDPVAPRSNSTAVYISIVDENDNSPEFTKSRETFRVFEDVAVGFSVANVSDSDGGDDGDDEGNDDDGDNNNNNTLFNEDLQIKLQLVQLVSNLVLLSSRNILHHVITILMQLTYFRHVVLCIYSRGCVTNTQHTQIQHNHTH